MYDKIIVITPILISIVALYVAYRAYQGSKNAADKANRLSSEYNNLVKNQNDMQMGQVQMQIREMITSAKNHFESIVLQLSNDAENPIINAAVSSALENVLNVYDEACAKYLDDNKVDKDRFKKMYLSEIRNIVTDDKTKDKYIQPQSRYQATIKVYDMWNN